MSRLRIFTDGSSTVYKDDKNLRYGGIGIYVEDNPELSYSKSYSGEDVSNQKMELKACLYAIAIYINYMKEMNKKMELTIITDSMYLINSITEWAPNWEKNEWKRKVNGKLKDISHLELIKKIYRVTNKYKVKYQHVRSHQVAPLKIDSELWKLWYGNQQADKLARNAMDSLLLNKP